MHRSVSFQRRRCRSRRTIVAQKPFTHMHVGKVVAGFCRVASASGAARSGPDSRKLSMRMVS